MKVLVLSMLATNIEKVLLYNRLYMFRLAGSGVDEDGKDPGLSVWHIDITGEVFCACNRATLGMNTTFERSTGTKRFECARLATNRQ